MLSLKVKKLYPEAKLPTKAYGSGDAGWDLYCTKLHLINFSFADGEIKLPTKVSTGIAIEIPEGFCGVIMEKSGLGIRGLHVLGGVVDCHFRGEILVICQNIGEEEIRLETGMKVAQLLILPVPEIEIEEVQELPDSQRGSRGFGSSGD